MATTNPEDSSTPVKRPIPTEGEDGLFTQSWFPICLAAAIEPGGIAGFDFLDGRIVVWRGLDGQAHVLLPVIPAKKGKK